MKKKKKQKILLISAAIVLVFCAVVSASVVVFVLKKSKPALEPLIVVEKKEPEKCLERRRLDGICKTGEEPPIFAVIIDNHPSGRPAAGLSQAGLVYEAIAESPITRFLAFFYSDESLKKIGPVRSNRKYFLEWAEEFNVPLLHVGGSDEALKYGKNYKFDLNEFYNGQYFWRENSRPMPHNVYTSSVLARSAAENKDWPMAIGFQSWKFNDDLALAENPVKKITIDFGDPRFLVEWSFDENEKNYLRWQGGKKQNDEQADELRAENVIVMYTESKVIDSYGRRQTKTIGKGKAMIFSAGRAMKAEWRRPALIERTRFFDGNGNEVEFLPGRTWVEVLPGHFAPASYE